MEIRQMNAKDYDAVYGLWMSCTGMRLNGLDDSREGIETFLRRNPDTCFVAVAGDGRVVGAILGGNDGRRGYLYHTAVHPDFRKQEIGRRLVGKALEAFEACGIHKVALVAFERNREGNLFWEKMGFSPREDLVYRNRALAEMTLTDT